MAIFSDLEYFTATIASGQSLSGAVQIGKKSLVGIVMPAAWTAAALSFQASPDGVTFDELYFVSAGASTEQTITAPAASQFIQLDPTQWRGIDTLKVRSGTAGTPVAQSAAAVITLVVRGIT
jgi:hypothetical protein